MADRVEAFNGYLDEMAQDMTRGLVTGAPVHVVVCDRFTPFIESPLLFTGLPGVYMSDWGHPNDLGYSVMAGGLPSGRTYWCELTVADERGNVFGVSNSPPVAIAPADSLVEESLAAPEAGIWDLGDDYYVEGGMIRSASPFPVWLPPAVMVGEPWPWEVAIRIPSTAPPSETGRVGVVLLGE